MAAESQELDNTSFKVVADFEEQRIRASEIWYRACAAEKQAELLRDDLARRRARLAGPAGPAQKKEIESEVQRVEAELKRVERAHTQLQQENERGLAAKNRPLGRGRAHLGPVHGTRAVDGRASRAR